MEHVRKRIRNAVALIVTGLPSTADRVHTSRMTVVQPDELPCLIVYSSHEQTSPGSLDGLQSRTLQLIVDAYARACLDLEDELDGICAEVESAVVQDGPLSGLVKWIRLSETSIQLGGEGDSAMGMARMRFTVNYYTEEGLPEEAA